MAELTPSFSLSEAHRSVEVLLLSEVILSSKSWPAMDVTAFFYSE